MLLSSQAWHEDAAMTTGFVVGQDDSLLTTAQGPVHTQHVLFELISMLLQTIFEMALTLNMLQ